MAGLAGPAHAQQLGGGCENPQAGAADLVNDADGVPLLVLPDDAGSCRIAALVPATN